MGGLNSVEDMHAVCVRFHKNLKTIEEGKRWEKLEKRIKGMEPKDQNSLVIILDEEIVYDYR